MTKSTWIGMVIVFVLVWVFIGDVRAQNLGNCSVEKPCTFSWNANTESDLSHYFVYYSQTSGEWGSRTRISKEGQTIHAPGGPLNLSLGQWWLAVSAIDLTGNESQKQPAKDDGTLITFMVVEDVDMTPPSQPTRLELLIPQR